MTRIRISAALLAAATLAACSKDGVQQISGPTAGSFVKFYNFAVNAPNVNFYAGDVKVTAISSTSCTPATVPPNPACSSTGLESTTGTGYGAVGNGGLYSTIVPAQYAFAAKVSTTTDNGLAISKLSSTLENGKYYSVYTSGFYDATAKTTDAFIVEDALPPTIDFTTSTARFVNAISNSSPITLFAKNTVTGDSVALGTAVAYKSASPFKALPGAIYDLTARYTGSNTAIFNRTGVSFVVGRVYTVSARGDMTVVSTTATNRPFLDNTANR